MPLVMVKEYVKMDFSIGQGSEKIMILEAILNLNIRIRSNDRINFTYEFPDPKNYTNHMLTRSVGQSSENLKFQDDRHRRPS